LLWDLLWDFIGNIGCCSSSRVKFLFACLKMSRQQGKWPFFSKIGWSRGESGLLEIGLSPSGYLGSNLAGLRKFKFSPRPSLSLFIFSLFRWMKVPYFDALSSRLYSSACSSNCNSWVLSFSASPPFLR
jgi:hypothetical protein